MVGRQQPDVASLVDVRIRLLGAFQVHVDGAVVADHWRLRKAKTLVKMLALAPGHRLHRDVATARLWPDAPARASNLHQVLHAARRALGGPPAVLQLTDDVIALCPGGGLVVDTEQFTAVAGAAGTRPAELRAALELWTGELLPEDRYEAWTAEPRARLDREHMRVAVQLATEFTASGAAEEACALVQPLAVQHPLDEPAQRALMAALAAAGRRWDALAVYDGLRATLDRELAAEPDEETRRLYRSLLCRADRTTTVHNLPAAVSSFVGRHRELRELGGILDGARALSLTGPGGAGKTRLAVELARRRATVDSYPDGVVLVELAGLRDGALVPSAVAATLRLHLPEGATSAAIVGQLTDRRMLLVLDNCEHMLEPCARLAAALLAGCPDLTLLATSREPLHIGEVIWRVPSLELPAPGDELEPDRIAGLASAQLFLDRARAVAPGFVLDADTVGSVAEICVRLDGIPLALELAAARLAHFTVAELADRLHDALKVLSYRVPGRLGRQQTLAATIEWSHALLTDDERRLFRRLAVFAGGFDAEAVEHIWTGGHRDPVVLV
jgi:DNA-binding SARP family transcriptional activator